MNPLLLIKSKGGVHKTVTVEQAKAYGKREPGEWSVVADDRDTAQHGQCRGGL